MRELSDELRRARRALDGFLEVESIGDWIWNESEGKWNLPLTVRHGAATAHFVSEVTKWLIVPDDDSLRGNIEFYPADTGSIEATFQHQRFNTLDSQRERLTGRPCLTYPSQALRRMGEVDPDDASEKLVWRVSRLVEWLNDAAANTLTRPGDPFEIPDFFLAAESNQTVAFQEDILSLQEWQNKPRHGSAYSAKISEHVSLIGAFQCDEEIVHTAEWGSLSERLTGYCWAIWIRLDDVPVFAPWRPPVTFGELQILLSKRGIDLQGTISKVADTHPDDLRDGKPIVLLIGFPIPKNIGEAADSIHWQTGIIPPVSPKDSDGFRAGSMAMRDKMVVFRAGSHIGWLKSENWSDANLLTRGAFKNEWRGKQVAIIGAGSLGSTLAELLVRGGCSDIILIDSDKFRAGNASRHVLELSDVGRYKVDALRERLQLIRPGVQIKGLHHSIETLRGDDLEDIKSSFLIIDATGNDNVLSWMEQELNQSDAIITSLSFGYAATYLYCFASPASSFTKQSFAEAINPWLANERATRPAEIDLPREGIGCWSVVFPARADDVWLLAATGVKWLENLQELPGNIAVVFDVFEQKKSAAGEFIGVSRAELPPDSEL